MSEWCVYLSVVCGVCITKCGVSVCVCVFECGVVSECGVCLSVVCM